jgi:hypothetical protein
MAYQNVGTPRFIIDWLQWYKSMGLIRGYSIVNGTSTNPSESSAVNNLIGLYPNPQTVAHGGVHNEMWYAIESDNFSFPAKDGNVVGIFGHNYKDSSVYFKMGYKITGFVSERCVLTDDFVVNANTVANEFSCPNNGFSLHSYSGVTSVEPPHHNSNVSLMPMVRKIDGDPTPSDVRLGCLLWGKYFDIPHSPDLSLKMTREMDGTKASITKGGSHLVGHRYKKSPLWGESTPPWDTPNDLANLSKYGRRTWDLSFSYLSDSDLFPMISNQSAKESTSPTGEQYSNEGSEWWAENTLLDSDTFYSQVIHKTNGGQLPFIFMPDKDNHNPDGFAICKFDMKSFQFNQVANGVYDIKLKIREVW